MQYDADTPSEYLDLIERDWRRDRLLAIRAMMLEVDGITEGIGYKMLQFRRDDEVFAHLNAQKSFVGVYLGDVATLDPDGTLIARLNVGKGCVRVRKSDDLELVRALIERKARKRRLPQSPR